MLCYYSGYIRWLDNVHTFQNIWFWISVIVHCFTHLTEILNSMKISIPHSCCSHAHMWAHQSMCWKPISHKVGNHIYQGNFTTAYCVHEWMKCVRVYLNTISKNRSLRPGCIVWIIHTGKLKFGRRLWTDHNNGSMSNN